MNNKKILVFGAHSLVGEDVCKELRKSFTLETHSRKDLDLTNIDEVEETLVNNDIDCVVYAAGLTDPEACEEDREKAFFLNANIPGKIARIISRQKKNIKLIYFSDAMVFKGDKEEPYLESDLPDPQSIYGKSRYAGEKEIVEVIDNYIIVRNSWLFGKKMKGIFKKLISIYEETPELKAISNFTGNPTWTKDVGIALVHLIEQDFKGIIHLAASGECSWYEYTIEFLRAYYGKEPEKPVIALESDATHLKSKRPQNSCLAIDKSIKLGISIPAWNVRFQTYVQDTFKEKL